MNKNSKKESYTKDVSVKEEPGNETGKSEVDRDIEMPCVWRIIVAPNGIHATILSFNQLQQQQH